MRALFIFMVTVAICPQSWAGFSSHILMCEVAGFDASGAKLACDPDQPKRTWQVPKNLIGDQKLKAGAVIKLALTTPQFDSLINANIKQSK
ncbi:MAG: hypothetical protein K2X47_12060 [Bdellovibrionales bacterium]|nr:hypothetical protein [Bdellovibrionales bacterium]